ncbi:hypothetical protein [Bartonella gliris]|uniref:hypothetical protein n=1 Tax=Bartonella gliris TaxID=3004109 RepID=UPI00295F3BB3|nr:hypothetical protein [Bartonella gliris]
MKMIYFITACATFASISLAQAASLIATQKLREGGPSSKSVFSDAQTGNLLGEVLRTKFSSISKHQREQAAQLVPVSSPTKKRGKPRGRPKLSSRGPVSF